MFLQVLSHFLCCLERLCSEMSTSSQRIILSEQSMDGSYSGGGDHMCIKNLQKVSTADKNFDLVSCDMHNIFLPMHCQ